jgi:hypothetical protein
MIQGDRGAELVAAPVDTSVVPIDVYVAFG